MEFYIYDIETYPNVFTIVVKMYGTDNWWNYEISSRRNDIHQIMQLLDYIKSTGGRMVGFNNVDFDYPVIHDTILTRKSAEVTPALIFAKVEELFDPKTQWKSIRNPIIPQVDLYRIWHFNNKAKSTSLKALEFWMRMQDIQDLPYEPGVPLTDDQIDPLIHYNRHDVKATEQFFELSKDAISFRDDLSAEYDVDFTNRNDVDIGVEVLAQKLAPDRSGRTFREVIDFDYIILHSVLLEHPEFQKIEKRLRGTKINPSFTKGVFSDLHATINGFQYDFGVGGLHGCISPQLVTSDETHVIVDLDVASYYPNLATANNIYPLHVGPDFINVYKEMYEIRKKYPKSHPLNKAMKLALNGSFGKTNSEYSWLYDPQYTFKITVNGQLLLAMLCEWVLKIEGLRMIQVNTDGITVRLPRTQMDLLNEIKGQWERRTNLVLEDAEYSRMWVANVNNYIAEYEGSGKLKRKGAYEYEMQPHQDPSALVVAKCAERVLVHGDLPALAVWNHADIMDFMYRAKVRRSDKLTDSEGNVHQRITRYFVSNTGTTLTVTRPPKGKIGDYKKASGVSDAVYKANNVTGKWDASIHTKNKGMYEMVKSEVSAGNKVTVVNTMRPIDRSEINLGHYIKEVEKLTQPILTGGV